jgi:phage tail-like protein
VARARYTDHLNVSKFQLLDVSFSIPMVLLPLFGFRSVSFPQLSLSYKQVKEGNYEYPRNTTVERAEITAMTLEQGVSLINSDFWDWIRKAVTSKVPKKNLLLIQFTSLNPTPPLLNQSALSKVPGASSLGGFGVFEDGTRIPGKAWMLYNCRPLSYKPGTDLDAMSGEISLATLEIQPEEIEEISIGV